MARILTGSHITHITGSIGGVTYQLNRNSAVAKMRRKRSSRASTAINSRSGYIRTVSQSWRALTASQRLQWGSFALSYPVFDNYLTSHKLSGYAMYCRCNLNLLQAGNSIVSTPTAPQPVYQYSFQIQFWNPPTSNFLIYTSAVGTANNTMSLIFFSRPVSNGAGYTSVPFFYINRIDPLSSTAIDVWNDLVAKFGAAYWPGRQWLIKCVTIDLISGFASSPFYGTQVMV